MLFKETTLHIKKNGFSEILIDYYMYLFVIDMSFIFKKIFHAINNQKIGIKKISRIYVLQVFPFH